jgi:hypothetical protein
MRPLIRDMLMYFVGKRDDRIEFGWEECGKSAESQNSFKFGIADRVLKVLSYRPLVDWQ